MNKIIEIRESQIEDILSTHIDITKTVLSFEGDLSLVGRQKHLPSGGILDLLFLGRNRLHLLELKVEQSRQEFCLQLLRYKDDLLVLQDRQEMPRLPINLYLACPKFTKQDILYCSDNDIRPVEYSPYELLKEFYFRVKAISNLVELKPKNHGVWNLYLINRILYALNDDISISDISSSFSLAPSTINSYLKLSEEFGLIDNSKSPKLNELGKEFVKKRDLNKPTNYVSDEQSIVLSNFIKQNPFFSSATYGIYTTVESVFALSKNFYPVPFEECRKFFLYLSGKHHEWALKASGDAFKMYSNYSIDLGLLARIGRNFYITPSGIRFILLLELNKSILFVNSL